MGVRRFDISLSYQENYELTDRLYMLPKQLEKMMLFLIFKN